MYGRRCAPENTQCPLASFTQPFKLLHGQTALKIPHPKLCNIHGFMLKLKERKKKRKQFTQLGHELQKDCSRV